jgi:glucose dehydrogenase
MGGSGGAGETNYVTRNVLVKAGDAYQPAQYFRHLVALDASTGQERWRYPASPAGTIALCIEEAAESPCRSGSTDEPVAENRPSTPSQPSLGFAEIRPGRL